MFEFLPVLLATAVAALLLALFMLARGAVERRRAYWRRRTHGDAETATANLFIDAADQRPPTSLRERIDRGFQKLVQQTGLGWTVGQALGLIALLAVVFGGFLMLWRGDPGLIGLGVLVGVGGPLLFFWAMQARWRRQVQALLPDTYFLVARSLRAGLSLEQALETVAQNGNPPVAEEFRRAVEQIKLGLTVPAALQGMGRRLRLVDFDIFVTVVTLHRTMGGNLTLLLDRVAATTRDRNLFRGYFQAATALGRITALFVASAAPVLFIGYALWQPEFVGRFFDSALGLRALVIALVLEVIGAFWLYLLLRVEY
jgi:tight adherence protein B